MKTLVAAIALVSALASAPRPARASTFDATTASGFGLVVLYTVPMGTALFATVINGTYWAYGDGSPRRWHTIGYVSGAAELLIGTAILIFAEHTSGNEIIGITPLVVGAASIGAAYVVDYPDDIVGGNALLPSRRGTVVTPVVTAHGVGIGIMGTF